MTKIKAFATHLGISLIIFLVILAIIVFVWYPPPFFSQDGGWQGIRIIAAVDLVLGPLLTLIVYKKGKPRLWLDMSMIALFQLTALVWGVWTVYSERPVAAVFSENRLNVVAASMLKELGYSIDELKKYGNKTPVWIYSKLPEDIATAQKVRVRAIREQTPIHYFTEYYTKFDNEENKEILLSKKVDLQKWISDNKQYKEEYVHFLKEHASKKDKIVFYSFKARYGKKVIALNSDDLSYVGVLDIAIPIEAELEADL